MTLCGLQGEICLFPQVAQVRPFFVSRLTLGCFCLFLDLLGCSSV